jgi:site-specific DNA-methyltransferase (cytosine-N4-specific)
MHLAERELKNIVSKAEVIEGKNSFLLKGINDITKLKKLVYFHGFEANGKDYLTFQSLLESSCPVSGDTKRQSTRYSVHCLHEYKGRFNPQIIRAIFNILDVNSDKVVLDPFCGSGTTLVESTLAGLDSYGLDMNPFAEYLTISKLMALNTEADSIKEAFERILTKYQKGNKVSIKKQSQDERLKYLKKWFLEKNLIEFETLRGIIQKEAKPIESIFLILLSDLIRKYSDQEPVDLRIRRRKSEYPEESIINAFKAEAKRFLKSLESAQEYTGVLSKKAQVYRVDSSSAGELANIKNFKADTIITSPPYATALPYIDTQRLSLVWLGLISPSQIREYQLFLTGSREMRKSQKVKWEFKMKSNLSNLPKKAYEFCQLLQNSLSETDGFRRQAVPILLYRYLTNMQLVFENMKGYLKDRATFATVVGNNKTTLGGTKYDIQTGKLLIELAKNVGYNLREEIKFDTYHRFGIHNSNSIKDESLIILEK